MALIIQLVFYTACEPLSFYWRVSVKTHINAKCKLQQPFEVNNYWSNIGFVDRFYNGPSNSSVSPLPLPDFIAKAEKKYCRSQNSREKPWLVKITPGCVTERARAAFNFTAVLGEGKHK